MVFSDIEGMTAAAIEEAQQAAQGNRVEADWLRGELAQVDRELSTVGGLLVDPDVLAEPMAKKTLLRKAAEVEERREVLQALLAALLDKANDDTGRLAEIVRAKFEDAKKRWEAIASPAQLNQLIGEFVGPSVVTSDGRLIEAGATKNPAHACDVHGVIAGACSHPVCTIVGSLFRNLAAA